MQPITSASLNNKRFTSESEMGSPAKRPREESPPEAPTRQLDTPPLTSPPPSGGSQITVHGPRPGNAFEISLCGDPGSLIIAYLRLPINPACLHDPWTLSEAVLQYTHLACASKAINDRVTHHPSYGATRAAITWLRNLQNVDSQFFHRCERDGGALRLLVQDNADVWQPGWPGAQTARTDLLIDRLARCSNSDAFNSLLASLFELTKKNTPDSISRMFIDPERLALSALSSAVRLGGFDSPITKRTIKQLIGELSSTGSLSACATFWAELAIGYRHAPDFASNVSDSLINQHNERAAVEQFVKEVGAFLDAPQAASHDVIKAMITHLAEYGTPLSPSSVPLLETLAKLEPQAYLDQSTRLRQLVVQYLQALNVLYAHEMSMARNQMRKLPIDLLKSAFKELDTNDKFKIVDIRFSPHTYGHHPSFYWAVDAMLPVIEMALTDSAIPLDRRWLLVNQLLDGLKAISYERAPLAQRLGELRESLASTRHALTPTSGPPEKQL